MKRATLLLCCLLLLPLGCRSVTNPFVSMRPDYTELPEAELRAAAQAIESSIQQGIRDFEPGTVTGVRLDSDEILQAIRSRAARQAIVDEFLGTGHAYEKRNGMLTILRTKDYKRFGTSRDRDRHALLVVGENENRWSLYEGILKLNNYPSRSLSAIQEIFYEARVEVLNPGQKYESPAGEIVAK